MPYHLVGDCHDGEDTVTIYNVLAQEELEEQLRMLDGCPEAQAGQRFALLQGQLLCSIRVGCADAVRRALQRGADPSAPLEEHGCPPLGEAAMSGSIAVMEELAAVGIDLDELFEIDNASSQGRGLTSALFLACRAHHLALVKWLLKKGHSDVNQRVKAGGTPMFIAACSKTGSELIGELIKAGGIVDAVADDGSTPLMAACIYGGLPSIQLLLDAGADPNRANKLGKTALHYVIIDATPEALEEQERTRASRMLIAAGADVSIRFEGRTPYELATQLRHSGTAMVLRAAKSRRGGASAPLALAAGIEPSARKLSSASVLSSSSADASDAVHSLDGTGSESQLSEASTTMHAHELELSEADFAGVGATGSSAAGSRQKARARKATQKKARRRARAADEAVAQTLATRAATLLQAVTRARRARRRAATLRAIRRTVCPRGHETGQYLTPQIAKMAAAVGADGKPAERGQKIVLAQKVGGMVTAPLVLVRSEEPASTSHGMCVVGGWMAREQPDATVGSV